MFILYVVISSSYLCDLTFVFSGYRRRVPLEISRILANHFQCQSGLVEGWSFIYLLGERSLICWPIYSLLAWFGADWEGARPESNCINIVHKIWTCIAFRWKISPPDNKRVSSDLIPQMRDNHYIMLDSKAPNWDPKLERCHSPLEVVKAPETTCLQLRLEL